MLNETLEYLENEEVKKIVLFLRQSSHLVILGHCAWVQHMVGIKNVNTPLLEFTPSTGAWVYSGTSGYWVSVHWFVLAAKFTFQNGIWKGKME